MSADWVDPPDMWFCTQAPHEGQWKRAAKALLEDQTDHGAGGAGACQDCWDAGLKEPLDGQRVVLP